MRGANPGNSRIAGSSELAAPDWLSIPDIVQRLHEREIKVSERQLERWREAKLLPPGEQVFDQPGHGGAYQYPPETVGLATAIHQLQTEKNDLAWIGWELWWRGWPAPEGSWRPELLKFANGYDQVLRRIRRIMRRERKGGDDGRDDTFADRVAPTFRTKGIPGSILASRIAGRVTLAELPVVLRLVLEAASGISPEYEPGPSPADQQILVEATDLGKPRINPETGDSEYVDDKLAGHSFQFRQTIGPVLQQIAKGLGQGDLVEAAKAPRAELEAARDDIRRVMEMVPALYQSTKWIYGEKALGLRFMNWVATRSPKSILRLYVLIWVRLRRAGGDLLSSAEIDKLHERITHLSRMTDFLKHLFIQGGDLTILSKPINIRRVLSGELSPNSFGIQLNYALKGFPQFNTELEQLISENLAFQSSESRLS